MKTPLALSLLVSASLLAFTHKAVAEDIDLFVGSPTATVEIPNVLFIIDNTANWSSASSTAGSTLFDVEKSVLTNIFTNLEVESDGSERFNVGVNLATETGGGDSNTSGGYIRAAIRPMTTANKTLYAAMFNTMDETADKGNGGRASLQFAEAYRYLSGGNAYAGNGKVKTDYTGNDATGFAATNGQRFENIAQAPNFKQLSLASADSDKQALADWMSSQPFSKKLFKKARTSVCKSAELAGIRRLATEKWIDNSLTSAPDHNPIMLAGAGGGGGGGGGNSAASKAAMAAIYALGDNALDSKSASTYNSPIPNGYCGKTFIIYLSNGANQENTSAARTSNTMLTTAGGDASEIPLNPAGSQDSPMDEWAKFMRHDSSLEVITYTIDIDKSTNGQGPGWTALLKSAANVSGGKYFDVSSASGGAEITDALNTIFSEILSVNSVFASVSLPVSVNTQGTYLNQVFVGLFRPDGNASPRWNGNLKQYKLGLSNNILKLFDADENLAINTQTGFITECARSFWTPTSVDTYWSFSPEGECLSVNNGENSNYPDGNVVEKGAAGYQLRRADATINMVSGRTVYTCDKDFGDCNQLETFDEDEATTSELGAANDTERDELISWQKGLDIDDEDGDSVTNEMRPSAHGDVVHSRPVAINYGTDAAPEVVVFYGANDGMLHAINGNRENSSGSTANNFDGFEPGEEMWAFVPPEFFSSIKRLRDNSPQIDYYGNTTTSPAPKPKPYGMDGTVTAYQFKKYTGSTTYTTDTHIYTNLRRGGRVIYAFDVTDPDAPDLLWKIGCPENLVYGATYDDTDCTSGMSDMAQAWSSPQPFTAAGFKFANNPNKSSPLLLVGGGYDPCEDYDAGTAGGANHNCTSSVKGDKVYVIDAQDGSIEATFDTERGVVGDIFVVRDFNQNTNEWEDADYAYIADLGGNIYRLSGSTANTPFGSTSPSNWTITKVADLGCNTTASCTANRKFMFGPDIIEVPENSGNFGLLIGSGDREKPLEGYAAAADVNNHFFLVWDQPTDSTWLSSESSNCSGDNVICRSSLTAITTTSTPSSIGTKGWYLDYATNKEQSVTSAITVFGTVTFSTHTPRDASASSCDSNLGTARVYNLNYEDASRSDGGTGVRGDEISGGGLPPSPIAGKVTLDDGTTVPFVIGSSPDSPIEGGSPTDSGGSDQASGRMYWYIEQ